MVINCKLAKMGIVFVVASTDDDYVDIFDPWVRQHQLGLHEHWVWVKYRRDPSEKWGHVLLKPFRVIRQMGRVRKAWFGMGGR